MAVQASGAMEAQLAELERRLELREEELQELRAIVEAQEAALTEQRRIIESQSGLPQALRKALGRATEVL